MSELRAEAGILCVSVLAEIRFEAKVFSVIFIYFYLFCIRILFIYFEFHLRPISIDLFGFEEIKQ